VLSENTEHFPKNDYGTPIAKTVETRVFCTKYNICKEKRYLSNVLNENYMKHAHKPFIAWLFISLTVLYAAMALLMS